MAEFFFALVVVLSFLTRLAVTIIALYVAVAFGGILGTGSQLLTWLFRAASSFLVVQFATRLIAKYREERANKRRSNAITCITGFIREANNLKAQILSPRSIENNVLFTLEQEVTKWQRRTDDYLGNNKLRPFLLLRNASGLRRAPIALSK